MALSDFKPTTISFFRYRGLNDKRNAFANMGRAKVVLHKVEGLNTGYMMGTGSGVGFSLWPDFSTYAVLCQWDSLSSMESFFTGHDFYHKLIEDSHEVLNMLMLNVKCHGTWYGESPFIPQVEHRPKSPIAVITRATIRISKAIDFWRNVPKASAAIEEAPGRIFSKGIGEWPLFQQATFSVWQDESSLKAFAYRRATTHADIIKKTRERSWYKEDLFARFQVMASWGTWNGANPLKTLSIPENISNEP